MKLVQLIAARGDDLPEHYFEALSTVHDQAPPLPWEDVRPVLEAELGRPPEKVFGSINPEAIAAASLGQVFSATLPDGTPVAVKVQYPGIREAVENDLRVFQRVFRAERAIGASLMRMPGLDYEHAFNDVAARLREELDYRREAANIEIFRRMYAGWDWVTIPKVYPPFSTSRVLTMDLIDGRSLGEVLKGSLPYPQRERLVVRIADMLNHEFFGVGIFHADAHPGNKLISDDGRIAQLDFGCIKVRPRQLVNAHVASIEAVLAGDDAAMLSALRDMGFYKDGLDPQPMLAYWKSICRTILEDRSFGEQPDVDYGGDKFFEHLNKLARAGYLHFPPDTAFGLRVMLGNNAVFRMLRVNTINWRRRAIDFFENHLAAGRHIRDQLENEHLIPV